MLIFPNQITLVSHKGYFFVWSCGEWISFCRPSSSAREDALSSPLWLEGISESVCSGLGS